MPSISPGHNIFSAIKFYKGASKSYL